MRAFRIRNTPTEGFHKTLASVCNFSFVVILQLEYTQSLKVAQVDRRNAVCRYGLYIFIINAVFTQTSHGLWSQRFCSGLGAGENLLPFVKVCVPWAQW